MQSLEGRSVLVTGCSRKSGLGFAICQLAASEGAKVYLTARDGGAAGDLAGQAGSSMTGHALDVTDPASIEAMKALVERDQGRLDVLINNAAGINSFGETAESASLDQARAAMKVTLFGSWALTQAMLPLLRKSEAGRVVMVSSGAGSHGDTMFGLGTDNPMGAGYGAAKAALNALTHRMAHEEAGRDGSKLKINAVCPGFTATFEGGEGMGARPPSESAKGVLWAAKLAEDGPSGGFFRDGEPLPW